MIKINIARKDEGHGCGAVVVLMKFAEVFNGGVFEDLELSLERAAVIRVILGVEESAERGARAIIGIMGGAQDVGAGAFLEGIEDFFFKGG